VAKLLLSVRSAIEAAAALAGGAAVIDVKEPSRGSLGRAEPSVWREVRSVVQEAVPVSVALGELNEWFDPQPIELSRDTLAAVAFCKLGLARTGADWRDHWRSVLGRLTESSRSCPAWVAVVYVDWEAAGAPDPDSVVRAASQVDRCRAVLFDTWDKSRRTCIDSSWERHIAQVRDSGRLVALAGSLDAEAIRRLRPLNPDLFAVRGAACRGGDRTAPIDPERVAALVEAAR
jgi:uncharacterized protein (UPF0264 family)